MSKGVKNARDSEPEYYYYDSKFVPTKFGLNNVGAICWCNSLIQLMLGIPSLNRTLLECKEELKDNPFACEYIKVLSAILPNSAELPPINASALATASAAVLGAMLTRMKQKGMKLNMGNGQECVDEAFTLFIDMFGCSRVEHLFNNVYELVIECTGCKKKVSSIRDKSCRIQMFTNVKLVTQDRFCTFLRVHPSECDYFKCDCGTVMTKFFRAERLKMLREVVVIVFNKFQMKDNRWFPQNLVFKAKDGTDLTYKLVGKIEHSGTRFGGHYWAQSLRDNSWQRLNDTSVTPGDSSATPGTFMIAYHIIDPMDVAEGEPDTKIITDADLLTL